MVMPQFIIDAWLPWRVTAGELDDIEDAWSAPLPELRKILRAVRRSGGMIHVRANDPWSDDALAAVCAQLDSRDIGLLVRVPVIDKGGAKLRDIEAFHRRIHARNPRRVAVIAESGLSKDVDGVKGEDEARRAEWVADAFEAARRVHGIGVQCYLGGTELAQATAGKHGNYDPHDDWKLVQVACQSRGIPLHGIIEAYSAKRMLPGAVNIVEAARFCRESLKVAFGIIPINDETDPAAFQAALCRQAGEIMRAVPGLDLMGMTIWNRPTAVRATQQDYWPNCLAAIAVANAA